MTTIHRTSRINQFMFKLNERKAYIGCVIAKIELVTRTTTGNGRAIRKVRLTK